MREKERVKMVLGREEEGASYLEAGFGFFTRGYLPAGKRGRIQCFCLAAFALEQSEGGQQGSKGVFQRYLSSIP